MKVKKRIAILLVLTLIMALTVACNNKQNGSETPSTSGETTNTESNWPNGPVEIVVPFNAGGDTDFHARTYAKYLEPILGKPVVVINVAGANGSAGSIEVKDAKPDGQKALFFHDSMLMNKIVGVTDFAHEEYDVAAAGIVDNSYILAVNSKSPYDNLDDLIKDAKENPEEIIYASSVGGYTYYVGKMIEDVGGVKLNIVDAGGGADRNAALLANKITTNVNPYGVMKPYIDSGDFKVLAVFSEERSELFPDVPTAKEQGFDVVAQRSYFLSFPKGTDPEILEKMSSAMEEVSKMPEYKKDVETAYAVEPAFLNTQDINKYLDDAMKEFEEASDLINGN